MLDWKITVTPPAGEEDSASVDEEYLETLGEKLGYPVFPIRKIWSAGGNDYSSEEWQQSIEFDGLSHPLYIDPKGSLFYMPAESVGSLQYLEVNVVSADDDEWNYNDYFDRWPLGFALGGAYVVIYIRKNSHEPERGSSYVLNEAGQMVDVTLSMHGPK